MAKVAKTTPGFTPRYPDYNLSALNRQTEHKGKVGAAWLNEDGSISIKLNPFVVLMAEGDLALTLFPTNEDTKGKKTPTPTQEEESHDDFPKEPGVIPF